MPGPNGVITVNGNTERSLRIEEQTAIFAAEVQASEEAARAALGKGASSSSKRCRDINPILGQASADSK